MTRQKNEGSLSGDLRISTGVNEMKWRQRGHGQKPRRQKVRFTVGGEQNERCGEGRVTAGDTEPQRALESHSRSLRRGMRNLWRVFSRTGTERVLLSTSTFRHVRAVASPEVLGRQQECSEPQSCAWLLSFSLTPLPNLPKKTSSTFKDIFRNKLLPSLLLLL